MAKLTKKEREALAAEMLRLWRGGERARALAIAIQIDAAADERPDGMAAYARRAR